MAVSWSNNAADDGTHDLCGRVSGKYVDVVHNDTNGTWSVIFDNAHRIKSGIVSRGEARVFAETADLRSLIS